jgi:hypothetical protein
MNSVSSNAVALKLNDTVKGLQLSFDTVNYNMSIYSTPCAKIGNTIVFSALFVLIAPTISSGSVFMYIQDNGQLLHTARADAMLFDLGGSGAQLPIIAMNNSEFSPNGQPVPSSTYLALGCFTID